MTYYGNYTTLDTLKHQYLDIGSDTGGTPITVDDQLLAAIIRDVSRQIDRSAQRTFVPRIETRYYDTPKSYDLIFDDDLWSLTSIINGDGVTLVNNTDYKLIPYNLAVKHKATLMLTSTSQWKTDGAGSGLGAISVAGKWGYARDGGFIDSGGVLAAAITSVSASSFTATSGKILEGWLIQIDSELMYVSQVSTGSPSDLILVIRGVNGSTAATHLISTPVYYWQADFDIEMLCRQASAAAYRIRANPIGDTIVIDGSSFATPRDVAAFIWQRLGALGYRRVEIG